MNRFLRRVLLVNSLIIGTSLALFFFSKTLAYAALLGGFLAQLLFHFSNIYKLEAWSRHPRLDAGLTGKGVWAGIFSRMYRHEKNRVKLLDRQEDEIGLFLAAAEALSDGIIVLDPHKRIIFCNPLAEAQFQLSAQKDRGQRIVDLIRNPAFIAYLQEEDFSYPLHVRSEYQTELLFALHVIPYADNRSLLQIKDITQQERVDHMRRDFVANVSHELRTPLTVLSGFVESLLEIEMGQEDRAYYLGLMSAQSQRMQSIVQDLLTLSSIESAPLPADKAVDASKLLARLQKEAEHLSAGAHHFSWCITSGISLLGEETELYSAFMNLVSNAIRYTPKNGHIVITFAKEKDGARFSVKDNGIGIPEKHIARLTERFYRVDQSRSREAGGTGLGLAIVKHVASRHQAALEIASQAHQGSVFALFFPKHRQSFIE